MASGTELQSPDQWIEIAVAAKAYVVRHDWQVYSDMRLYLTPIANGWEGPRETLRLLAVIRSLYDYRPGEESAAICGLEAEREI